MKLRTVVIGLLALVCAGCAAASHPPTLPLEASLDPEDAQVLQIIRDAGTDMSLPREIGHFLYFDREEQARAAAADVPPEYSTEVYKTTRWVLHATHTVVLNESYVVASRAWWEDFARQHGTEYDGWDAASDPQP
jgi:hypothetical protein